MKVCCYCGRDYPDEAVVCEIDQTQLVAAKPESPPLPTPCIEPHRRRQPLTAGRLLSVLGFAVLSGFTGFGLTWLVVGIIAGRRFQHVEDKLDFAAKSMPVLIIGGIVGFIAGLIISLVVATRDSKTEAEIEEKYVGFRGRYMIYSGVPIFIIALVSPCFERLLDRLGTATGAYVFLGLAMVILAVSLGLYDRIPAKFIVPIGVIGWLLTLSMILWFGVFKHAVL